MPLMELAEIDRLGVAQKEAIMQVTTSWEEQGIEKGIEQGQRSLISLLLNQKFGSLPDTLSDRVSSLSPDQLSSLAIALLDFGAIEDLSQWLEVNG
jgi:hypothetical protein